MKTYWRIGALFIAAVVVLAIVYAVRQTSLTESDIVARERSRVYESRDKVRMEKDPIYAFDLQDKLQFLDYRQAVALNRENRPDEAIAILERLIREEEAKGGEGAPRRSRSYLNEARAHEAIAASYDIKHDTAAASKAMERRAGLMAKAVELERNEMAEEGKRVGSPRD